MAVPLAGGLANYFLTHAYAAPVAAGVDTLDTLIASGNWPSSLGEAYIASNPDVTASEVSLSLESRVATMQGSSLLERVQHAIDDDFASGRLCDIDGWVLSETECRLSALAALSGIEAATAGELESFDTAKLLELVNWGPRSGRPEEPFNLQPSGNSALWLRFQAVDDRNYKIYFGERRMITSVHPSRSLITADLLPEDSRAATARQATIPITLVNLETGQKQRLGDYEISGERYSPDPADPNLIRISRWGPRSTTVGEGFNLQPSGESALWIRTDGTHRQGGNYAVELGGVALRTTVRKEVITASILPDQLSALIDRAGELKLELVDEDSKQRRPIGKFIVSER